MAERDDGTTPQRFGRLSRIPWGRSGHDHLARFYPMKESKGCGTEPRVFSHFWSCAM